MLNQNSPLYDQELGAQGQRAKDPSDIAQSMVRSPRFITALALPLGIFGTFMGLYNKQQIDLLRTDLKDTMTKHNRLVEIVQQQDNHLFHMDKRIWDLQHALEQFTIQDPAYISSMLILVENRIRKQLQTAAHTIQMAQQRCLSIDLLTLISCAYFLTKFNVKLTEAATLHFCHIILTSFNLKLLTFMMAPMSIFWFTFL
jgi:hypothetical protein